MKIENLYTELYKQGITLAVTDDGQNLTVTGSLTDKLRATIREHKQKLIEMVRKFEQAKNLVETAQALGGIIVNYPDGVIAAQLPGEEFPF